MTKSCERSSKVEFDKNDHDQNDHNTNNQAHPLWSEPDCIRFSCHVSPELLVTSAVKSPLVRRKVRPKACQPYTSKKWPTSNLINVIKEFFFAH